MARLLEGFHDAEFIHSCANGTRSFREGTITAPEGGYEAGTILSLNAGVYTATAVDGTPAAILVNGVSEGTSRDTVMVADAEVSEDRLIYADGATPAQITTINTALDGLGIVVLPTPPSVT